MAVGHESALTRLLWFLHHTKMHSSQKQLYPFSIPQHLCIISNFDFASTNKSGVKIFTANWNDLMALKMAYES